MIWESSTGLSIKFAYGNGACPACAGGQLSALTDPKGNTIRN